jgi:peptide/nickel transport system permease protein
VTASEEDAARLRAQLGLDRPVLEQYGDYLSDVAHGDFGDSVWQGAPAMDAVLGALPASLYLALVSVALAIAVGLPLGLVAGMRPGSLADRLASVWSTSALSMPDFWLGLVLIIVFAVHFEWLPTSGYGGLSYVILPAVTLAARPAGRLANVTREAVAAEMSKRYVVAARAKGLPMRRVMTRHVLKNVVNLCVVIVGYDFVFLFTGAAMTVEVVFAWPGVGRLAVQATLQQDVVLVSAAVIVAGVLIALVNMVLDIVTAAVDRRVAT